MYTIVVDKIKMNSIKYYAVCECVGYKCHPIGKHVCGCLFLVLVPSILCSIVPSFGNPSVVFGFTHGRCQRF